jgi:cytochrome oxidase Cu insertion factor (SCO1/SenC/PrrC family)
MNGENWKRTVPRSSTLLGRVSHRRQVALMAGVWSLVLSATLAPAQEEKKSEEEFVKESPTVGDRLPDVVVYDSQGNEFRTSQLGDNYSVLTFGCLT